MTNPHAPDGPFTVNCIDVYVADVREDLLPTLLCEINAGLAALEIGNLSHLHDEDSITMLGVWPEPEISLSDDTEMSAFEQAIWDITEHAIVNLNRNYGTNASMVEVCCLHDPD